MSHSYDSDKIERPSTRGVRTAIVRDNEDPDNLARVKLEYPWRNSEALSDWAPIATEMTGTKYGTYFLPEVGDKVLVAFENGDIHSPIVIGSLWSGKRKPPADNSDGNNDVRTIVSRKGHRIEFNDNKEDGNVGIVTQSGHVIVLDDTSNQQRIEIRDNSGNRVNIDAENDEIAIQAKETIKVEAKEIEVGASDSIDIECSGTIDISASGELTLEGSVIREN